MLNRVDFRFDELIRIPVQSSHLAFKQFIINCFFDPVSFSEVLLTKLKQFCRNQFKAVQGVCVPVILIVWTHQVSSVFLKDNLFAVNKNVY